MARSALWLAPLAVAVGSCVGSTPVSDLPVADPSKVVVFYSIDGRVRGRGGAGTFSGPVEYVYVASHPSEGSAKGLPTGADGSFQFEVVAGTNDVIEIAASRDVDGRERGTSIFLGVPRTRLPSEKGSHFCCKATPAGRGGCQKREDPLPACDPSTQLLSPCDTDRDCLWRDNYVINFGPDAIAVSRPSPTGTVEVRGLPGQLPPNTLVRIENRGKSAIGGTRRLGATAVITDDTGAFVHTGEFAAGDDELVLEAFDLAGNRSLPHAVYVPDAELASFDIVGAFAFEALDPGRRGRVAVRLAATGKDSRGICPDSGEGPALCFSGGRAGSGNFSGGIDHSMVSFERFTFDQQTVSPQKPTTSEERPELKFVDGDVLGNTTTTVLILDESKAALTADPSASRRRAARTLVSAMRSGDKMALYTYGRGAVNVLSGPTADRAALLGLIDALPNDTTGSDEAKVFAAIQAAADFFIDVQPVPRRRSRIVAIVASAPSTETREAIDAAAGAVVSDPGRQVGIATHVLASGIASTAAEGELENLALGSFGEYWTVGSPDDFVQRSSELAGRIAGAFILLYDVDVPATVGKFAAIEIDATLTLPNEPAPVRGSFRGFIEVANGQ